LILFDVINGCDRVMDDGRILMDLFRRLKFGYATLLVGIICRRFIRNINYTFKTQSLLKTGNHNNTHMAAM